jgi:hypothetical protein
MKHSIVYYCTYRMYSLQKPANDPAGGLANFENCTFVGGRNAASSTRLFELVANTTANLNFKDCIVSGRANKPTDASNVLFIAGTNTVTAQGCALTTDGLVALRVSNPFSRGVNATIPDETSYITANADLIGLVEDTNTDPSRPGFRPPNPDFMNVQNPAFATASSTGGPLGGAALFVGPPAKISDWASY